MKNLTKRTRFVAFQASGSTLIDGSSIALFFKLKIFGEELIEKQMRGDNFSWKN